MENIKLQEDGNYYEKIITWRKEPDYTFLVFGIIIILIGIFLFVQTTRGASMLSNDYDLINSSVPDDIAITLIMSIIWGIAITLIMFIIWGTVLSFLSGICLVYISIGEGKEVKFKRIRRSIKK